MRKDERGTGRVRRLDHWIYLDRWWAHRLGVTRTAGMYRIRSRELARRLAEEKLGVDASGTVFAYGMGPAATSISSEKRLDRERETATPRGRGRFSGPSDGPGGEPA